MKISLSKQELEKAKKLLEVKENNITAAEHYIDFLTYHSCDISDDKNWFEKFQEIEQIEPQVLANSDVKNITKLDPKIFTENEYYKTVGQVRASNSSWKLMTLSYEPFEGFVSDEISVNPDYFNEHTPISYFDQEFKYLAVLDNDEIWMSVIPHEINTMKQPIKNAKGDVLVLGLGLGYYVFNILNKKEVNSVTVIENDKRIISLFNEYLLPKFPHQEKLSIIYGDAIEFVRNSPRKFDYVFADIWHNVGDGEMLYLKIKNKEKYHPEAKFDYWIETSILAMLRRQTLIVFEEQLQGEPEALYLKAKNDNDRIINKIYFYLKDKEIKTFNDLHDLLTDESLKVMASNLF